ncbi:PEPxxWA-CTERM sorting domain-containing protein [Sandaracinobacteroides saxicola]|uniref:PEPxxWA-CTERM sorting domain-containing protein n=1 Tax=Sandaracinobacteroides saxicola TaxID=2759707 RepID=A0A7G5IL88_9SPHN|nr:PEPxxWA-CTERM sorting domain-containing protein [Sandaracinobacteroides saxicola]QMW24130.1 PEPxxWA-CTERM sorting domain-containing protein [Sandaracinobacteroides saxicola]
MRTPLVGLLLPIALIVATPAAAVAIIGGTTRVAVNPLPPGLTPGLLGTATLGPGPGLSVDFPITGGLLDGIRTRIFHEGSGVSLTGGTDVLALENFIIAPNLNRILGDVTLNGTLVGSDVPLFLANFASVSAAALADLSNPSLVLRLTPQAIGALNTAFGVTLPANARFGTAASAPSLVPEASVWATMILGFGLVGLSLRRRPFKATLS